jgi:hypothetical protein
MTGRSIERGSCGACRLPARCSAGGFVAGEGWGAGVESTADRWCCLSSSGIGWESLKSRSAWYCGNHIPDARRKLRSAACPQAITTTKTRRTRRSRNFGRFALVSVQAPREAHQFLLRVFVVNPHFLGLLARCNARPETVGIVNAVDWYSCIAASQRLCNHPLAASRRKVLAQIQDDARKTHSAAHWPQPKQARRIAPPSACRRFKWPNR